MTHLIHNLYAVPVPVDSSSECICADEGDNYLAYKQDGHMQFVDIPNGEFKIVGYVTAEHINFDPSGYVDKEHGMLNSHYAFHSLLQASGIHFTNPYGEKDPISYLKGAWDKQERKGLKSDSLKWQAAQQALSKKVIIIEKI